MKKKHRNITVGGVKYAWTHDRYCYTVWRDKKQWFYVNDDGMILPSMVALQIKNKLSEESSIKTEE